MNMNEIMALALLVMQAGIIAGIGYACHKTGYDQGYRAGMDMQKLIGATFERDGTNGNSD